MFTFQSGRGFSGLSMFRTKYAHLRSHDANLFILHFIIVYYYFAVATVILLLAMMLLISDLNHVYLPHARTYIRYGDICICNGPRRTRLLARM